jgi:hypothetical protein
MSPEAIRGPGTAAGPPVNDAPSMKGHYVLVLVVEVVTLAGLWIFQRTYGL